MAWEAECENYGDSRGGVCPLPPSGFYVPTGKGRRRKSDVDGTSSRVVKTCGPHSAGSEDAAREWDCMAPKRSRTVARIGLSDGNECVDWWRALKLLEPTVGGNPEGGGAGKERKAEL